MFKGLPTLLIVTTVAIAIWVVAEAESVRTETFNPILAIDQTGVGGHMARPDSRLPPARIEVVAEGSAAALDALGRALGQGVVLAPTRGLRDEPGTYSQDLRSALISLDAVAATGVTIASVEPSSIMVEVAEQESIEVAVELQREGLNLEGDPVINPPRVTITGPKALIDLLNPETSRARVELTQADLDRLIPGQSETVNRVEVRLPVEIPAGQFWGTSPVSPPVVDVTLTLRAQVRTIVIPRVSVLLMVAPVDYNDWDVLVSANSRDLRNVTLTGPSDAIGQYERGERRIDAFVRLNFEDLEAGVSAGTITRSAQFGPLAAGVAATCEDLSVELEVRTRAAAQPEEPVSPESQDG